MIAGDGTTVSLPSSKDIEQHFGVHSATDKGIKRYLARVFFLYDVLNDFVLSARLSKMQDGEKTLMVECLAELRKANNLLILDRGFGHFCTIKELIDNQQTFCIRLSCQGSNFAKAVMKEKGSDIITLWHPTSKEKQNSKKNELNYHPIKVRVVKIKLITGETEVLVTNLYNQEKYTVEDLNKLYSSRWGVEEGFKNLKPKMKLEQFGCRKRDGIFQEFYAHIFCMNMVALVGNVARSHIEGKTKQRRWQYSYNWKNAYRFLREKLIKLLLFKKADLLIALLITQISSSTIAIIPERQFVRETNKKTHRRSRINQIYK